MKTNSNRRHALFIASTIGDATSGVDLPALAPSVVNTAAGPMSSLTGTFGSMNFGVPVRLSPGANLTRHWGAQAFRTPASEAAIFPTTTPPPAVSGGLRNDYSNLGLRARAADEPASSVNGVMCMAYDDAELAAAKRFYARFGNAVLARFAIADFQKLSWQILPDVQWVYCVVTTDAAFAVPSYESPILQTYLDKVMADFQAYGDDFAEELLASTRSWSSYWLNDRIEDLTSAIDDADAETASEKIDSVLAPHVPRFHDRKRISSYALNAPTSAPAPEDNVADKETVFTNVIKQSETKFFCFGMGSLINTPSRVGSAGKVAQCAIPIAVTADYDFAPCWNFQNRAGGSQLTAGGMVMRNDPRNKNPNAETGGVVYPGPSDAAAMAACDEREVGYTRYNIPTEFIRSLNWCQIPPGITVFQYLPNTELPDDHPSRAKNKDGSLTERATFPPREYPLPQTYVDVCLLGCLEYSAAFAAKWISGFVGWPSADMPYWINDRPSARTPWESEPSFQEVDELLVSEIPASFACRRLPAEYARFYVGDSTKKTTDVSYISYTAGKRAPAVAADQTPTHFIFEYDDRIAAERWAKVITQSDIEQGMACRLSSSAGFARSFCLRVDEGFTAPALVKDPANARHVNGVLYAAPMSWVQGDGDKTSAPAEADDPFCGDRLSRVKLAAADFHVLANFMSLPPNAVVYTYAVSEPCAPSYEFPIRQTTLDAILGGCMEHSVGEDFAAEWVDSTAGWKNADGHCFWLNDRLIARRPWMALGGSYKVFDRLVYESTSPCVPKGVLLKRRLAEEYPLNVEL